MGMVGDGCEGRNKWVGISSTLVWCSAAMRCTGSAREIRTNETYASPTKGKPSSAHSQHLYLNFQGSRLPFQSASATNNIYTSDLGHSLPFSFFSLLFFFNRRCSSVSSLHPSSILFISITSYLPSFLPSPLYPPCSSSILLLSFSFIISFCFFLFIVNISCIITSIACTPHTLTSLNTRTKTQTTNGRLHI